MPLRLLCPLFLLLFLASCRTSHLSTDLAYNSLGRAELLMLDSPGYVLGIEKLSRDVVNCTHGKSWHPDHFQQSQKASQHFAKVNSDGKILTLTHIVRYEKVGARIVPDWDLLNSYETSNLKENLKENFSYDAAFPALDGLKADMAKKLQAQHFTHIVIASRGWNNDQHDGVSKINIWMREIGKACRKNGLDFRPLVVCITWPSSWWPNSDSIVRRTTGKVFSYFHKADDADEAGYTFGNILINQVVRPLRDSVSPDSKIVCIGHSFGARLLATAVAAEPFLISENKRYASPVDMCICLQAAFSVNRLAEDALGGSEDVDYLPALHAGTQFVLTNSEHDTLAPIAKHFTGAKHAAGRYGWRRAEKSDQFDMVTLLPCADKNDELSPPPGTAKPDRPFSELLPTKTWFIDASNIVKSHGDVNDEQMAYLIADLLKQL